MYRALQPGLMLPWLRCLVWAGCLLSATAASAAGAATACDAAHAAGWAPAGMRIDRVAENPSAAMGNVMLPAHCELFGTAATHVGIDGQHYAIRFHLRLPDRWNGRFIFQGGGGLDGDVGDALGALPGGIKAGHLPELAQGYAVVSEDGGHDSKLNFNPARGGAAAFGFDPQARADYGHASLAPVAEAALKIIANYYGRKPAFSYFMGCSKGGEEGMVFAQQHPALFDGILAEAPGFALPRAAVAEEWDVQSLARAAATPTLAGLRDAFGQADLDLVSGAILQACDGLDGLKDGIVSQVGSCTPARVDQALRRHLCAPGHHDGCLTGVRYAALQRVMAGAHRKDGTAIYAGWPWDPGIAAPGWRMWKLGSADGKVPALNVVLGGTSLPSVFTVPPQPVPLDPQLLLGRQLAADIDHDADVIQATDATFHRSGWDDSSARSADLAPFIALGGKLIVPHGVADPVFSISDTLDWFRAVDRAQNGTATRSVRVFPVPGMNHCGGGPATDRFDAFAPLVDWVEHGHAPDAILAAAGPDTPWPGRTRPLCAYPAYAHYLGGDPDKAASFVCRQP